MSSERRLRAQVAALAAVLTAAVAAAQTPPAPEPEPTELPGPVRPGGPDELPDDIAEAGEEPSFVAVVLTTGAGNDTGFRSGDETIDDLDAGEFGNVYLARVGLLADRLISPRTRLTAAYEPEIERFVDSTGDDSVNHAVGVLLDHQASRRTRWVVGGSLLDGDDASRFLSGLLVVVPRTPYQQTRAFAAFEHQLRHTTVAVTAGYAATQIAAVPGVLDTGIDETELFGAMTLDYEFTPRVSTNLTYSWVDSRESEIGLPDLGAVQAVMLGVSFRPGPGWTIDLGGGLSDAGETRTTLANLALGREGQSWTGRLTYDRSLAALAAARRDIDVLPDTAGGLVLRDSVVDTVTLDFFVRLAQRVYWEQVLRVSRTELPTSEVLEGLNTTGRLLVRITDRLGAYAEGDHFDQRATAFSPDLSRTRWSAGLVFGFGGPAGPRGLLVQRESQSRVLPQRGGR